MNLKIRIISNIGFMVFFCMLTIYLYSNPIPVLLFLVVMTGWRVCRDLYLSRWVLEIKEDKICVKQRNKKEITFNYHEIRRVNIIRPSLNLAIYLFNSQSDKILDNGGVIYKPAFPIGINLSSAFRRLWTISEDLLIQSVSGKWVLFPQKALDGAMIRELWMNLRMYVPKSVSANNFNPDPAELQKAIDEEKIGSEFRINREWSDGITHLQNAAELWESMGHMDSVARCLSIVSDCHLQLGQITPAIGKSSKALDLSRNMKKVETITYVLNQLAEIGLRVGNQEELNRSLKYLDEAAELHSLRKEHFQQARMHSNMAIIYEKLYFMNAGEEITKKDIGKKWEHSTEIALNLLTKEIKNIDQGIVEQQKANVNGSLARYHYYQFNWDESIKKFELAESQTKTSKRGNIPEDISMWGRAIFKKAMTYENFISENIPANLINSAFYKLCEGVTLSKMSGGFTDYIQTHIMRGDSFWELKNTEAAVRDYEAVICMIEGNKILLEQVIERTELIHQFRYIYERAVEGFLKLATTETAKSAEYEELAFRYSGLSKARALSESMDISDEEMGLLPDEIKEKLQKAIHELLNAKVGVDWLRQNKNDKNELLAWKTLQMAEDNYLRIQKEIETNYPGQADFTSSHIYSRVQVQSFLPEKQLTGVLEFFVGEENLCVFFISNSVNYQKKCFLVSGLGRKQLFLLFKEFLHEYKENENIKGKKIKKWMVLIPEVIKIIQQKIMNFEDSKGHTINQLIIESKIERLVIIPDGILHRLPIHAALEINLSVSYCPNCNTLIHAVRRAIKLPTSALVVANPGNPPDDNSNQKVHPFLLESNIIQQILDLAGVSKSVLENTQATKEAILNALSNVDLFHFAGHGFSNFNSPLDSYLDLSDDKTKSINQYLVIKEEEQKKIRLSVQDLITKSKIRKGTWVIANACESGIVAVDINSEYLGIPSALLMAGASMVISTLWRIDTGSSIVIIEHFYNSIFKMNFSPDNAMKEATNYFPKLNQADFIKKLENHRDSFYDRSGENTDSKLFLLPDHPYHHAPFIVYGASWTMDDVSSSVHSIQPTVTLIPFDLNKSYFFSASPKIKETDELIKAARFSEAINILESLRNEIGPATFIDDRLATCYSVIKDNKMAKYYSEFVVEADKNNFLNQYNLGCTLRDMGKVAEARNCFRNAIMLNPAYSKAYINLAQLKNDPKEALDLLKKASVISPEDEDIPNAKKMWRDFSSLKPAEIAVNRINWAGQLSDQKKLSEARVELSLVKELWSHLEDNAKAAAYFIESNIFRQENLLKESIEVLEKAVKLNPLVASYWNNLAARRLLFLDNVQQEEKITHLKNAEAACNKAIDLADQIYARPFQNLAFINLRLSELTQDHSHLIRAKVAAQRSIDIALKQFSADRATIVCKGCTTQGNIRDTECSTCLKKGKDIIAEVNYASGSYTIN